MATQLNIKDPETVRLARELARSTGKSVTETVRDALRQSEAAREAEIERKIAELDAVVDRIARLLPPEWEGRTSKEIMDEIYDEDGLPK
ncbi:MAG TPA: type II toxin-antitoxin system VapB family antitoxin [Sphingomonas sp.]|jgi:antitoxin VapB